MRFLRGPRRFSTSPPSLQEAVVVVVAVVVAVAVAGLIPLVAATHFSRQASRVSAAVTA
jgi:cell division protein FtsN